MEQAFEIGQRVKDQVSGMVGVVVAAHRSLHEPERYEVQPPAGMDGQSHAPRWFTAGRLEATEKAVPAKHPAKGGKTSPAKSP